MTTCAVFDAQMERYLSGSLSAAEAEALELHAGECERCGPVMESRTRLERVLPPELVPDPARRDAVLTAIATRTHQARRGRWWVPAVMAAGLMLAFGLTRPRAKSGQLPPVAGSPAAIAAERADGEFRQLDAARAELRDAIAKSPRDPVLLRALERLDAQRKSLENLIQEFES
jgi:hypothetical protein